MIREESPQVPSLKSVNISYLYSKKISQWVSPSDVRSVGTNLQVTCKMKNRYDERMKGMCDHFYYLINQFGDLLNLNINAAFHLFCQLPVSTQSLPVSVLVQHHTWHSRLWTDPGCKHPPKRVPPHNTNTATPEPLKTLKKNPLVTQNEQPELSVSCRINPEASPRAWSQVILAGCRLLVEASWWNEGPVWARSL